MKLQYLGDYRDAFKWDLLHWTCTEAQPAFQQLVFVPLLTPDDADPRDGRISANHFAAREFIGAFVESLRRKPRRLDSVINLGAQDGQARFQVNLHAGERHVQGGTSRKSYWEGLDAASLEHSLVFLDPDNGFETKTNHGPKWVLHDEVRHLLKTLPASSAVVVYQHKPHRKWGDVFADLKPGLEYAPFSCAVFDATLAFVALAADARTFDRVQGAFSNYASHHRAVGCQELRRANA